MATEVRVPSLGESVSEGVIARWLKRTGDHVEVDEIVLELETDKAAMEVRSPAAGQLEVVQPEGATVPVGAVVGRVDETKQGAKPGVAPVAAPATVPIPGIREPRIPPPRPHNFVPAEPPAIPPVIPPTVVPTAALARSASLFSRAISNSIAPMPSWMAIAAPPAT